MYNERPGDETAAEGIAGGSDGKDGTHRNEAGETATEDVAGMESTLRRDGTENVGSEEGLEYKVMNDIGDLNWDEAYRKDPVLQSIYKKVLETGPCDECEVTDGLLTFNAMTGTKTCIPSALMREVLHIAHDSLGQMGYKKTYDRIAERYYRPKLSAYVEKYVSSCSKCSINKLSRTKLPGNLLPIDVSGKTSISAFECIGLDFIVSLPLFHRFDAIIVVIDKFTRYGIFIPTTSDYTARSSVNLLIQWVVRQGWLPSKFITDRDGKFLSDFWQGIMEALGVRYKPSTAYHAQTDGATERLNQNLEIMLRADVSPLQDDWSDHLAVLELAYNTAKNASTGQAPVHLL